MEAKQEADLYLIEPSRRAIGGCYWWLNMQKDAQEYVKKCNQCQRFTPNIQQPRGVLNPLSNPWPFAQ